MAEHMQAIEMAEMDPSQAQMVREILNEQRARTVEACVQHGHREEVVCVIQAKTSQELDLCHP